jgi:DNA-binding PadR family transcriptional regulator
MSVRWGLLALLGERPMYGYQLRQEFEARTGGTWPLNIGQVYTTLSRLARDGLVEERDRQEDGAVVYALTPQGGEEVSRWWVTPVDRTAPARDELAIKLALAVTAHGVDVAAVVQRQRAESMRALQEYTRLKARAADPDAREDVAWLLVLDSLVFAAEAEVRWLDHVEQRLVRLGPLPRRREEEPAPRAAVHGTADGTVPGPARGTAREVTR